MVAQMADEICLDFEELLSRGIGAMGVHISDAESDGPDDLYYALFGWESESILVMKPKRLYCYRHGDLKMSKNTRLTIKYISATL